jgi:hypothetical protein
MGKVKDISSTPSFMIYALTQAIRHPRTPIRYGYCPRCDKRLPQDIERCPVCDRKVRKNPEHREQSPIPWWGSVIVMALGIICWVVGAWAQVAGLDEAGRAMVYVPLGNLFGMSLRS